MDGACFLYLWIGGLLGGVVGVVLAALLHAADSEQD